ncbi:MAG: alkaline phosphatase D family protein [Candidatus Hydrogenedentota bacterium]
MKIAASILIVLLSSFPSIAQSATLFGDLQNDEARIWTGPDVFANRLLDWRVANGRLECIEGRKAKPLRTLHLLSHTLSDRDGSFSMQVQMGPIEPDDAANEHTWSGFLVGAGGAHVDYRTSALAHHWPGNDGGIIVALDGSGNIVFRDNAHDKGPRRPTTIGIRAWPELKSNKTKTDPGTWVDRILEIEGKRDGDSLILTARVRDSQTNRVLAESTLENAPETCFTGNVALISHLSPKQSGDGYWFRDWEIEGDLFDEHDDRDFGPIVSTQYTLSGGTLKITAQMAPMGEGDSRDVYLDVNRGGEWKEVSKTTIQPYSFTATLRVDNWSAENDTPYRVRYSLNDSPTFYEGTIRSDPVGKETMVVAAFTGHHISAQGKGHWNQNHFWYPHNEVVDAVKYHNPDLLFFSGDQIYEGGLSGIIRNPADDAIVDYLYHWYRWCLAFRKLTRDTPSITLPDDHDVYQGNIWGAGGRKAESSRGQQAAQDTGGYTMDPLFVNAVHRTQVSHLPDPVDPKPIEQGITTYHTNLEYGGISFAILADRMFKSSPTVMVPDGGVINGWFEERDFDPAVNGDPPGSVLLGDRQEAFLEDWANTWDPQAYMKVVLSQTIFANIATLPKDSISDKVVQRMQQPSFKGEYIRGDKFVADGDSNGWPKSGRDRALRAIRKGFAFHIAGDQHLGSFSQYGIDDWNDAGFALCVPSIANLFPRRWFPPEPGANRDADSPEYTGEFHDGFGNKITVHAVSNPEPAGVDPAALYDRAPGYGIVRFNKKERTITSEVWPRWVDPSAPDAKQYPGWPITVNQMDNYNRKAVAYLPELIMESAVNPLVQVVNEAAGEIVYTVRIKGNRFRPKVFATGIYTVRVSSMSGENKDEFSGIRARTKPSRTLKISF